VLMVTHCVALYWLLRPKSKTALALIVGATES
jgi:hypothetical protein